MSNNKYWVSCIVQETENSKPWLCAFTSPFLNLEEAKENIVKFGSRLLSAWVDKDDGESI